MTTFVANMHKRTAYSSDFDLLLDPRVEVADKEQTLGVELNFCYLVYQTFLVV